MSRPRLEAGRQVRLDRLWGTASAQVPDAQVVASAATKEVDVAYTKQELQAEDLAEAIGKDFVKNGSRDRFGEVRRNVGGRPKKLEVLGVTPTNRPSNRRGPGSRKNTEFGAREKLKMKG